ncbi:alpha/beta-hydrolase [Russula brevipes]|nr:alpha/beta-hydrolase [Russula brevipes]
MAQPERSSDAPTPSLTALTFRQWLRFLLSMAILPLAIAVGVFRENKGRSWSCAANIAMTRYLLAQKWDLLMFRTFSGGTTSQAYQKWARQEKQPVLTDILPEGAKLHWIGQRRDTSQDRVLLYFHGGGFSIPAGLNCFRFLRALQMDVSASLGDVGVALLEYSLAPESPIPTQLRQANAALTHLLNKGIAPANIIISGDSAGGNLVLQLASHILHPLPSIPAPPMLAEPLAGALLISPWCSYSIDAPSYGRNDAKDIISAHAYGIFASHVRPGLTPELGHHGEPLTAPPTWWEGLDGVYGRVLVTAGEYECPFDQIIVMSRIISQSVRDTGIVVEPEAVHEEMIFKFATGDGGSGKEYDAVVRFLFRSFEGGS